MGMIPFHLTFHLIDYVVCLTTVIVGLSSATNRVHLNTFINAVLDSGVAYALVQRYAEAIHDIDFIDGGVLQGGSNLMRRCCRLGKNLTLLILEYAD